MVLECVLVQSQHGKEVFANTESDEDTSAGNLRPESGEGDTEAAEGADGGGSAQLRPDLALDSTNGSMLESMTGSFEAAAALAQHSSDTRALAGEAAPKLAQLRHSSGAEVMVDIATSYLRSWHSADGSVAPVEAISLVWPSVVRWQEATVPDLYPEQPWHLVSTDSSNTEPSVTLACAGGSAQWLLRRTLALEAADRLREQLWIENLALEGDPAGTLRFEVRERSEPGTAVHEAEEPDAVCLLCGECWGSTRVWAIQRRLSPSPPPPPPPLMAAHAVESGVQSRALSPPTTDLFRTYSLPEAGEEQI